MAQTHTMGTHTHTHANTHTLSEPYVNSNGTEKVLFFNSIKHGNDMLGIFSCCTMLRTVNCHANNVDISKHLHTLQIVWVWCILLKTLFHNNNNYPRTFLIGKRWLLVCWLLQLVSWQQKWKKRDEDKVSINLSWPSLHGTLAIN